MPKNILVFFLIGCAPLAVAQDFQPVEEASSVIFMIKNFGVQVQGSIYGLQGNIRFDPNRLSEATFDVRVDAGTIDTGIGLRNKHLKKEQYFDVAHYNHITFTSTKVEIAQNKHGFVATGNLTLKGTTRQIKIEFEAVQLSEGYQLKGQFKINRLDFKVGGSTIGMGNELAVFLSVIAR
jgi:polyisoprenoid-binding protein YceI